MLKIYHLHEKIVDYEEYIDRILESSFNKKFLEDKIVELENKYFRDKDCNECPLYFCSNDCDSNCEGCVSKRVEEVKDFCKSYIPFNEEPHLCRNFTTGRQDRYYYIEEKDIDITKDEILKLLDKN